MPRTSAAPAKLAPDALQPLAPARRRSRPRGPRLVLEDGPPAGVAAQPLRWILVRTRAKSYRFLDLADVTHVEAQNNYVRLHTAEGRHLVRATLQEVESRVDAGRFLRIHRSMLVNIEHVRELVPWFNGRFLVRLENGAELHMSRSHARRLRAGSLG